MKKRFLTAAAVLFSLYGYSQTQGTSALSLGISTTTNKVDDTAPSYNLNTKTTSSTFRLGYGLFVRDNQKVGIDLIYGRSKNNYNYNSETSQEKSYGAAINYQHYFPLIKTFYAFAGGGAEYMHADVEISSPDNRDQNNYIKHYRLDANGGLAWFISKRWALETSLISAGASLSKLTVERSQEGQRFTSKTTNFNLSSDGLLNNLGFRVYLMF